MDVKSCAWSPAIFNLSHPGGCDGNCINHGGASYRDCHIVNLMTATCTKCHDSNNPGGGLVSDDAIWYIRKAWRGKYAAPGLYVSNLKDLQSNPHVAKVVSVVMRANQANTGNDSKDENSHYSKHDHKNLLSRPMYNSIYLTPMRHFRSAFLRKCNASHSLSSMKRRYF